MANEFTINSGIKLNNPPLVYSSLPTSFQASQTNRNGPTPGSVTIPTTAGGTGINNNGAHFYDASSSNDLAGAIEDAAVRVGSCRFDLAPDHPPPSHVTVGVNGHVVARDPTRTNGWDLMDTHTLELFGDACAAAIDP